MLRKFMLRIVLPTVLTIVLFVTAIYILLIPALERSIMARKREMIRELTISAWNVFANLEEEVREGVMSEDEAKKQAIRQIRHLHYGPHLKDYFWVNDMYPRMVVHPYRPELEGADLSEMEDPNGKRLFVEMVELVKSDGEGFLEYMWQWKDEAGKIAPKLSFVKGFPPWGWVIGTGIYIDDVNRELSELRRRLAVIAGLILAVMSILLLCIVFESLRSERQRVAAEQALRRSEARYRQLVESAGQSIIMYLEGEGLSANVSALRRLGYSADELKGMQLSDVVVLEGSDGEGAPGLREVAGLAQFEGLLRGRDDVRVPVMLSRSPIRIGDQTGIAVVATDMTEHKRVDEQRDRSEVRMRGQLGTLEEELSDQRAMVEELRTALMLLEHTVTENAPAHLFERIKEAESPGEVFALNQTMPWIVKVLVENGYKAENINRFVTVDADRVVHALLDMAIAEQGPPPAEFAFIIMGSEGRREQTLCTDQDNAIIYADPEEGDADAVREYFLKLGECICAWLDAAGYSFCEGEMMARNPKWCMPLSSWKALFRTWIRSQGAEDLLQSKIFFDFRCAYGNAALADELRSALEEDIARTPSFLGQLARDVLQYSPPLGLFGNIQLQVTEDGRKAFDIKSAMTPIVDLARIYALRHCVPATNTVSRLDALRRDELLPKQSIDEVIQVYSSLMQVRIEHQVRHIAAGEPPDNFVVPQKLTLIEQKILKESFVQIKNFQTRMSYDFTGMPGRM